jgi:hypothetical protein
MCGRQSPHISCALPLGRVALSELTDCVVQWHFLNGIWITFALPLPMRKASSIGHSRENALGNPNPAIIGCVGCYYRKSAGIYSLFSRRILSRSCVKVELPQVWRFADGYT